MDRDFVNLISELLKVSPVLLKEDSTIASIPEWDSLSHWLIIGELEEKYSIEFTLDEATGFKNLGEIYKTLMNKL